MIYIYIYISRQLCAWPYTRSISQYETLGHNPLAHCLLVHLDDVFISKHLLSIHQLIVLPPRGRVVTCLLWMGLSFKTCTCSTPAVNVYACAVRIIPRGGEIEHVRIIKLLYVICDLAPGRLIRALNSAHIYIPRKNHFHCYSLCLIEAFYLLFCPHGRSQYEKVFYDDDVVDLMSSCKQTTKSRNE